MDTRIININENDIDFKKIREAADLLNQGGLVAFPTETVYGLGADALNEEAVSKIYEAKGRPGDNPLIVHIWTLEQLPLLAKKIPEEALVLAEKFWPGPLTMVLEAQDTVPRKVTGGLNTVAVRMPGNDVALAILKASNKPIAAPSANISGRPSPTQGMHVIEDLEGRIDAVVFAENTKIGIESTVLDLTVKPAVILRPGSITLKDLEKYIEVKDSLLDSGKESLSPKSPGTKYRHYAPRCGLFLVTGDFKEKRKKFEDIILKNKRKIGFLLSKEMDTFLENTRGKANLEIKIMGSVKTPEKIVSNFYALLREFDSGDAEIIYMEEIPLEITGKAFIDRVEKASGGNRI